MPVPVYKLYKLIPGQRHVYRGQLMDVDDVVRLDPARVEAANLTAKLKPIGDSEDWSSTLDNPAADVVGLVAGIDSAEDLYELRAIEESTRKRRDVLKAISERIEQVI